jgi:hypothetical protein
VFPGEAPQKTLNVSSSEIYTIREDPKYLQTGHMSRCDGQQRERVCYLIDEPLHPFSEILPVVRTLVTFVDLVPNPEMDRNDLPFWFNFGRYIIRAEDLHELLLDILLDIAEVLKVNRYVYIYAYAALHKQNCRPSKIRKNRSGKLVRSAHGSGGSLDGDTVY